MARDPLAELEHLLGHRFTDRSLLDSARSHDPGGPPERMRDHRRLAFLGDLVWGLAVGVHLYRTLPGASVAELTRLRARLVAQPTLVRLMEQSGLSRFLHPGCGEQATATGRNPRILAEVLEAMVGALYLDGGFPAVTPLIEEIWRRNAVLTEEGTDPKSSLQILLQSQGKDAPRYRIIDRQGPAHAPSFTVQVFLGDSLLAEGRGPSRRRAEGEAAAEALRRLTHNK